MDSELEKYLPFVKAIAKRYTSDEGEIQELLEAGSIGLVEAAGRFDEGWGIRFITFAVWYIRRSLESCLMEKGYKPPFRH